LKYLHDPFIGSFILGGEKAQLYRKERVQDDEPAFVLRRIASGVKPEPPEVGC